LLYCINISTTIKVVHKWGGGARDNRPSAAHKKAVSQLFVLP